MAHEITSTDTPIFHATGAWHGLGTVVENAPTPLEALKLAGLDWTVQESEMLNASFGDETDSIESFKALRRSDTKEILHVATSRYKVMQNETLARLMDEISTTSGMARIESAGSLKGGRIVWFLAKAEAYDIGNGDTHVPYLLGTNAHNGTNAVRFLPTNIRVVCANTHTAALNQEGGWSWKHTGDMDFKVTEIQATIAKWNTQIADDKGMYEYLASREMTRDQINELWVDVLIRANGPIPKEVTNGYQKARMEKVTNALGYMAEVFDRESQTFGASALIAANAATNWLGHANGTTQGESREASNFWGSGARQKNAAFKQTLQMV